MESVNNSSTPIGKMIPIFIIFVGLLCIYYLYEYLFGPSLNNAVTLISRTRSAQTDINKPIIVSSDNLPPLFEGGEFTVSTWIYISNWTYRAGLNKPILSIGGPNFDTIRIYLGATKPKLFVRLHTLESNSGLATDTSNQSESLDIASINRIFGVPQTDSGLLEGSQLCDLPEVNMQRWVNIAVAVNGKTVDVYMDGKLARSCVLPRMYKVDSAYSAKLLGFDITTINPSTTIHDSGFGGQIATTMMYDYALNPEVVYKNYMAGPKQINNIGDWFASIFSPGFSISVSPTQSA